ncbi:MAG: DUF4386 domain-containing protein [Saprospiraceae bacterium]|nr:DUF4386 domain-containing protein [Saprospiraceae bacterium]
MNSDKKTARLAGLLYLLVIIFGVFAEFYVRAKMILPDNASQTVQQILDNPTLFRLGFVSDLLMQVSFLFLSLVLFQLFKKVDQSQALFMVISVGIGVAIMCLNMLNQYAALLILEKGNLAVVFSEGQINELVLMFLNLQKYGYRIAQLFFGIWLFPLGYLVCKSEFMPKIIGILLVIACFSFIVDFFLFFLLPNYSDRLSSLVTLPTTIGEFSMCLWLLIVGVRINK